MKKYLFAVLSLFLLAAAPTEVHQSMKSPNLQKMDIDELDTYYHDQDGRCNEEGILRGKLSKKEINFACEKSEDALEEIKKRGYCWGPHYDAEGNLEAEANKYWIPKSEHKC